MGPLKELHNTCNKIKNIQFNSDLSTTYIKGGECISAKMFIA